MEICKLRIAKKKTKTNSKRFKRRFEMKMQCLQDVY